MGSVAYSAVTLEWPGGENSFSLGWAELRSLEGLVDRGPMAILAGLQAGQWKVDHLVHILRLGLIGSGMDPIIAKKKVAAATEAHPPAAFVQPAILALAAGLMGGVTDADLEAAADKREDGADA